MDVRNEVAGRDEDKDAHEQRCRVEQENPKRIQLDAHGADVIA